MPSSYKGTELNVSDVHITGHQLSFRVVFRDKDGVVHGHLKHTVETTVNKGVAEAVEGLAKALLTWAGFVHFNDASQTSEVAHGIAESFRRSSVSSDEPGSQG